MEVTEVGVEDGKLVASRPILQDSKISKSHYKDKGVIIGRLNAFEAKESGGGAATVEDVEVELSPQATKATMVQRGEQRGEEIDIEGADILVAGGRGLGKAEGFELAEELAKALGGAVAATRAVVDAGWYPYSTQIGQTGKTVAPKLYLAAGISGAIQHKVGMQASENIVAINKDSNAPIFEFSDLGIIGDLNKILPKLTEAVKAKKGELRAVSSDNGVVVPRDYPPPVDSPEEFIKRELDAEDDLIEVGVAIVGGGTAGLACANRLLQLLAEDPATMERLGEVPVAVIEKAKVCGGHSLSGAVIRPAALQDLFPDMSREDWRKEGFAYGEVDKEAVYMLPTKRTKLRIPPPPPFRNHGNEVISVSALARYQQRQAEEAGAYILTETSATQLIVEDGRVMGVRSGDKGRGKDGEPLRQLRARHRHQGQRDRAGRGLLGPPHRRGDPRVRPRRRPRAPGVGARGQGGLEGPQAAGPPDPHGRALAGEALVQVRADRRDVDVSDEGREDGRRPGLHRVRHRPRVRRCHDLGPRPAPAVQDPSPGARDPRGRRAGRLGRQGPARRAATGRCPS